MKSALVIAPFIFVGLISAGFAQDHDPDELSKKLANWISDLISLPFQNNFDFGAGPDGDGFHYYMNVQPVIPIKLNEDWNLISRTILPINYADYLPESNEEWGLGDTEQSFFLSPSKPGPGGLIWVLGRSSCCQPPPMISLALTSGALDRPPLLWFRRKNGRSGYRLIIFGHLAATTTT